MDNYLVSARKYRPDTFESVVGQNSLTKTLKNAIRNNQLAQAYLFCGPRGVGKTTCARIFAKTINCMNPGHDGEACNVCESCKSFNEQRSLNIFELDAASNNSVDGIRVLVDQVRIPPQLGKYKVYIIDEVHMLSTSAFNAFLKTLEEPPRHAIFILATTEKHKIIPTILSRCQIYDFNRISVQGIVAQLKHVAKSEHIEAEDEALNIIAVKSDGGMRDALSIFDQVASFGNGKVTYQDTITNLNVLDYDYYFKLTTCLLEGDLSNSLLIFNDILSKGFDGQHFITGLSNHIRDLMVCKDASTLILLEVGANIRNQYQEQSAVCPLEFLYAALRICNDCDLAYKESKNKRLLVELALIRISQLTDSKKKIRELLEDDIYSALLPLKKNEATNQISDNGIGNDSVSGKNSTNSQVRNQPERSNTASDKANQTASSQTSQALAGKLKSYMSIRSIRTKANNESETNITSKQQEILSDSENDFQINDLINCWNEFSSNIKEDDLHLSNAMKSILLTLNPDKTFVVNVNNPLLMTKLEEIRGSIEAYLKSKLENKNISMKLNQVETPENYRPFTAKEKLDAMVKKNPNLLDLYRTFGLDLK
jgi:DNA polymerase-3 subunit gamma/tau